MQLSKLVRCYLRSGPVIDLLEMSQNVHASNLRSSFDAILQENHHVEVEPGHIKFLGVLGTGLVLVGRFQGYTQPAELVAERLPPRLYVFVCNARHNH